MIVEQFLPQPTEEELNLGAKANYFERLLEDAPSLQKKHNISLHQLVDWIHHNYQSIFLLDKELGMTEFKKLK
jgi:hypothetical protein